MATALDILTAYLTKLPIDTVYKKEHVEWFQDSESEQAMLRSRCDNYISRFKHEHRDLSFSADDLLIAKTTCTDSFRSRIKGAESNNYAKQLMHIEANLKDTIQPENLLRYGLEGLATPQEVYTQICRVAPFGLPTYIHRKKPFLEMCTKIIEEKSEFEYKMNFHTDEQNNQLLRIPGLPYSHIYLSLTKASDAEKNLLQQPFHPLKTLDLGNFDPDKHHFLYLTDPKHKVPTVRLWQPKHTEHLADAITNKPDYVIFYRSNLDAFNNFDQMAAKSIEIRGNSTIHAFHHSDNLAFKLRNHISGEPSTDRLPVYITETEIASLKGLLPKKDASFISHYFRSAEPHKILASFSYMRPDIQQSLIKCVEKGVAVPFMCASAINRANDTWNNSITSVPLTDTDRFERSNMLTIYALPFDRPIIEKTIDQLANSTDPTHIKWKDVLTKLQTKFTDNLTVNDYLL